MQLYLPSRTLKEKRSIVKSILSRSRNRYNVASAEVDMLDVHDHAVLAFVTVNQSRTVARRILENLEQWVVDERPDVEVLGMDMEEC